MEHNVAHSSPGLGPLVTPCLKWSGILYWLPSLEPSRAHPPLLLTVQGCWVSPGSQKKQGKGRPSHVLKSAALWPDPQACDPTAKAPRGPCAAPFLKMQGWGGEGASTTSEANPTPDEQGQNSVSRLRSPHKGGSRETEG